MTDTIKRIENWFEAAVPSPSADQWQPQLAVHIEEFTEMLVDGLGHHGDSDLIEELSSVQRYYKLKKDTDKPNDLLLLDSLADQIVTAIGIAKMRGYDISSALAEVAASNESKFYYVGEGQMSDNEWMEVNSICREIEAQARYKNVGWERQGAYVIFKDSNGKILKNPRTYYEPDLNPFIKGE